MTNIMLMQRSAGLILIAAACAMLACTARGAASNGQSDDKAPPMTPTNPPPSTPPTPGAPASQGKPKTTLEQVQQAYPGYTATVAGISVPGVELFALHTADRALPNDAENLPRIVAIVGGVGSPILEGRDVTRAAAKATKDAALLAKVAMAVERRGGEILTAPKNDEQKKAQVVPPAIAGTTLTFWVWTSGVGRMLMLAKVDLTTGALELGGPPESADDKIARALEGLAGTSLSMHQHAIKALAAACASDPKARKGLLDAASGHKREETRAAAVEASPACGAAAVDALIRVMEHDASSTVRWKAAKALGEIGDRKAKPALEKAANSGDANVKSAATRALEKLK